MVKRLRTLNSALPALWLSILLYGIVCQIAGFFLVGDKLSYSLGLWIGIILALLMAYHMAYVLSNALDMGERFYYTTGSSTFSRGEGKKVELFAQKCPTKILFRFKCSSQKDRGLIDYN